MHPQTPSTPAPCFHRWTRKRYAAFQSMHKTIKIGVLSVIYTIIAAGGSIAAAQIPSHSANQDTSLASEQSIADVVIAADAATTLPAAQPALRLTRSHISDLPAQDLQHLLEYAANIDLRQRGANGVQADIRMRGGSEEQTIVMLNGVNFSDPRTAHHSLNLPIDLNSIERIEIVQLPGTFAGAVNIITHSPPSTQAHASITTGSHYYSAANFNINYVKPTINLAAAASHLQSDGYTYNTDFQTANIHAHSRFQLKNNAYIEAQIGYQHKQFGANSFYSVGKDEYENVRTIIASAAFAASKAHSAFHANIYLRRSYDNYAKYRDSLAFEAYDRNQDNYHQTDALGSDLHATNHSTIGKTTLGATLRAEHIFSNRLGEPLSEPQKSFANGINFTRAKWRFTAAPFVSHAYSHKYFALAASAAANYSNSYGCYPLFNAHAAFTPSKQWNATLSLNQGLRLPSFTDLYYSSPRHQPNPALLPEQAATIELSTQYSHKSMLARIAAFYRSGRNIIDWLAIENNYLQAQNYVRLTAIGAEAYWHCNFNKYLHNLTIHYAYLTMKSPQTLDGSAMGRLFSYLRHKISLSAAHNLTNRLQLAWAATFEQRNGTYTEQLPTPSQPPPPSHPFAPLFLLDARLQWHQRVFSISLAAENLLNTRYYDYNAVPQPTRWLKAAINVRF